MKPRALTSPWPRVLAAIVWLTAVEARAIEEPRAVFVMQRDGSGVHRVVAVPGARWHGSPRWSHDGTRLAFDAYAPKMACHIYIVGADGKHLRDLGTGSSPNWSPDDKQIVFETSAGAFVQT